MHGRSQFGVLSGRAPEERAAVFASGGLFPGWAAIDTRACFEHSLRGGPGLLGRSWSGARASAASNEEHLHARGSGLGHLGAGAQDPAARERLARLGTEWFEGVERARRELQGLEVLDARQIAELQARNLIGERR
jgi:hypothetical protein